MSRAASVRVPLPRGPGRRAAGNHNLFRPPSAGNAISGGKSAYENTAYSTFYAVPLRPAQTPFRHKIGLQNPDLKKFFEFF